MRMILLFLLLMIIVLGPQLWVWWVFRQYRQHREDLGGTGGELARHLLNRFGLQRVRVEPTPMGDHYNPETKVVGLNPKHYNGRSLTAAVIAAHEVGHALQDHEGYALLKDRTHLIKFAQKLQQSNPLILSELVFEKIQNMASGNVDIVFISDFRRKMEQLVFEQRFGQKNVITLRINASDNVRAARGWRRAIAF